MEKGKSSCLTVAQLRLELNKAGLVVGGKRSALLARYQRHLEHVAAGGSRAGGPSILGKRGAKALAAADPPGSGSSLTPFNPGKRRLGEFVMDQSPHLYAHREGLEFVEDTGSRLREEFPTPDYSRLAQL